ncbi:hypothetical protein JCM11491_001593 [Sporobolomyces phaffii]
MSYKHTAPRRRKTLAYPSPPSSVDSVSSCSSFSSTESSPPTSPRFTTEFTLEPRQAADYSFPPPTAQFFSRRVHSVPQRMTKRQEWSIWYSANFGSNLLEPVSDSQAPPRAPTTPKPRKPDDLVPICSDSAQWENILIHLLFLSIIALTYVALSRVLTLSPQLVARLRFYATGGAVVDKALVSSL